MVGKSNQNVFLIQIDASSFAEFEYPSSRYRDLTVTLFGLTCWYGLLDVVALGAALDPKPTVVAPPREFCHRGVARDISSQIAGLAPEQTLI